MTQAKMHDYFIRQNQEQTAIKYEKEDLDFEAGFKKIEIQYYQKYNFSNHLGWFLKRKPGGHEFYKEFVSDRLNASYCENLKRLGQTDSLIAIAE